MSESKQDVFDEMALEYQELAASLAYLTIDTRSDAEKFGKKYADKYRARYAAAGKVAVPREVGRYLGWCETFNIPLHVMFNFKFMRRQGFSPLNDGIEDWICDNPDDFARAWLNDWYAEEDAE
jgi:hypothetical protein